MFSALVDPLIIHGVAMLCFKENVTLGAHLCPTAFKPEFYVRKVSLFEFELGWGYVHLHHVLRATKRVDIRVVFAEKFCQIIELVIQARKYYRALHCAFRDSFSLLSSAF
jgi:hypothetical protein